MIDLDKAMRGYAATVASQHSYLTMLDQNSGDGDFGDNLCGGLDLVLDRMAERAGAQDDRAGAEPTDAEKYSAGGDARSGSNNAFEIAAEVFLDHVGGTSGPLFGLLFQAVGAAVHTGATRVNLAQGVVAGLAAIQRVGEARVGDRTLVDALAPGAEALAAGDSLAEAARQAEAGAQGTTDLRARMGRASYVGDRARGYPDPGAIAIAFLFHALTMADDPAQPSDLQARERRSRH